MPTGYTADVATGKVAEFREFAMQCARAFGALVTMRDDAPDAPIPDAFEPANYYQERLDKAIAERSRIHAMTVSEAVEDLAKHNAKQATARQRLVAESADTRKRYEAMLSKATAWVPPTTEHQGLKDFMVQQLTESIRWDCHDEDDFAERCYPSFAGNASEWLTILDAKADQEVEAARKSLDEEVQRCRSRTAWLRNLRDSLR